MISFLVAAEPPIQNPSSRGTNRKKRPWSRTKPPGGDAAGPVCWKESRVWAQLLGFVWQKKVQLSMQLLPSRAGVVMSQCSMGPDTGDWSQGGVAAGRAPGQQRRETFRAFRHFVISLFIWEEKTTQGSLVSTL